MVKSFFKRLTNKLDRNHNHYFNSTLKDLQKILNEERKITLAREITKIHEEFIRGNINEIIQKSENLKGEIVLIIEGNKESEEENSLNNLTIEEHYKFYENQGFSKKDIIKKVAKDSPIDSPVINSLWTIDFSTENTHAATTQKKKYKPATTLA